MIVKIEEKEYSTRTLKLVRAAKGLGDRVMTKIDNAGLRAGEIINGPAKGPRFRFKPKTSHQLNRETIQLRNKAVQAKGAVYEAIANPGNVVDKGVEMTVRNPISVASQVGGKVAMVSGNPALAATPIGAIGTAGEQVLKKKVPAYGRTTERLGNSYHNSTNLRRYIVGGTNTAVSSLRSLALV